MEIKCVISVLVVVLIDNTLYADAHAFMEDPLLRSAAARVEGIQRADDSDLSCGGREHQWMFNGGKCGVCGDPYGDNYDQPNEVAGNIVAKYTEGFTFTTKISLFENEMGWFEFRLCPLPKKDARVTQSCLDDHLLKLDDGSERYFIEDIEGQVDAQNETHYYTEGHHIFFIKLRLPVDVVCDSCVLQLWYQTLDPTGEDKPKTYVNCADIKIEENMNENAKWPVQFDENDVSYELDRLDSKGNPYPGLGGLNSINLKSKFSNLANLVRKPGDRYNSRGFPYPGLADMPPKPYDNRGAPDDVDDDVDNDDDDEEDDEDDYYYYYDTTTQWDTSATASSTESTTNSATEQSTESTTPPPVLAREISALCDRFKQIPNLMVLCRRYQQRNYETQNWYGNRQ